MNNKIAKINYDELRKRPVKKILIIKLRAIGDVLLSTIIIKNLRAAFPDAQIDFLTERSSAPVLEDNPFLNNVLIFQKPEIRTSKFLLQIRRKKYDLVIDLFCNPRAAFMTFFSGAPIRVGYAFRGRGYAYNVQVPIRSNEIHNAEFNLDPIRFLNIPVIDRTIRFYLKKDHIDKAKEFLHQCAPKEKIIVALNPSGTWETKRWGLDHFAELGDILTAQYSAYILLIWGPCEYDDVVKIQNMMKHTPIIAPQTSLKELGALLSQCSYMISNDSGPMHLTASLDVPTLGIYGPTNPVLQGPYHDKSMYVRLDGLTCLSCNLTKCTIGNICMKDLSVDRVLKSFDILIEKNRK